MDKLDFVLIGIICLACFFMGLAVGKHLGVDLTMKEGLEKGYVIRVLDPNVDKVHYVWLVDHLKEITTEKFSCK